ncbi:MAG: mitochondrial fission ELM1 family protein [Parahaliea sp.]
MTQDRRTRPGEDAGTDDPAPEPLTLWCLTDGKPGHCSQLLGLSQALAARWPCRLSWLDTGAGLRRRAAALGQRPDLILCAGHRTHLSGLRLRWHFGGALVTLMKPSLPHRLFDLCIVPRHDLPRPGPRVLPTRGTLNDIRPATDPDPGRALILIGGPSRHHGWDDAQMLAQLRELLAALPALQWSLTTSRRTPDSFLMAVTRLNNERLTIMPVELATRDWLLEQYRRCATVWVSEDSVSMVYEALATGAAVGVLAVPRQQQSRVSRGLDQLLESGFLTRLATLRQAGTMPRPQPAPNETDRVADYLLHWISERNGQPLAHHESPAGSTLPQ